MKLDELRAQDKWQEPVASPCSCVGPQNGQPLCPCAMRSVRIEGGRYIQRIDLGPASLSAQVDASKFLGGKS